MSTITAHTNHTTLINVSMQQNPTAREHMVRCAEVADEFEPHLYTVESVHSAS